MRISSLLRSLLGGRRFPRGNGARLSLETLEERTVPDASPGRLLAPGAGGAGWLHDVYERFLGRAPEGAATTYWLGRLADGAAPAQVAGGVLASAEYAAGRGAGDGGWLASLYGDVLRRTPDGSGRTFWQQQLGAGQGRDAVAVAVLHSPEFLALDAGTSAVTTPATHHATFHPLRAPNDPFYLSNTLYGLSGTYGIQATTAWDTTTGSTKVTVAVIDTGIDFDHPDLYKNIWVNQKEIPASRLANLIDVDGDGLITFWDLNNLINRGPGKITDLNGDGRIDASDLLAPMVKDQDGSDTGLGGWADGVDGDPSVPGSANGYVDDLVGWNFFDNNNRPFDDNSHGTHVSGTIGAVGNNLTGVAGVNWKTQIMALRFIGYHPDTNSFDGSDQDAASAIHYAADNGARVSNNSYGGGEPAPIIDDAVNYAATKGHVFVVAAGNGGSSTPLWPAASHLPNMITVAATDVTGGLASFSTYGPRTIDVAAPGVGVTSTVPGGNYASYSGTSMATPHVAGTAALLLSVHPDWSFAQVKDQIVRTTTPRAGLVGKTIGGLVNAARALVPIVPGPVTTALADFDGDGVKDLYVVKRANTASQRTEIDVYDGAGNYQNLLFHTATALVPVDATFFLQIADYNGDGKPDLFVIAKANTGSHTTEIHVLNGASGFQTFLLHTATGLGETGANFDFQVVDTNRDGVLDLVVLVKSNTGSHTTEVHVLDGASGFQTWSRHTTTGLGETGANFDFQLVDINRDGALDLVAFLKSGTGTRATEIHVLDGASGFQNWVLHTGTGLTERGAETALSLADFNGDGTLDLVAVKKYGTASGKIELDVLDGSSSFTASLAHVVTGSAAASP